MLISKHQFYSMWIIAIVILIIVGICNIVKAEASMFSTGADLYLNIQKWSDPKTTETIDDVIAATNGMGYISGYIDSLVINQELFHKRFGTPYIDIPTTGVSLTVFELIFKKYIKEHPNVLNRSTRACIFKVLVDTYGWVK